MEEWFVLIILGVCGLWFLYLGYLVWRKEKINLIHDYHYSKVKESDKKAYTGVMGKAMMVMGIGMILSGVIYRIILSEKCMVILVVFFVLGLGMITYAQIRYNHGIF